MTVRPISELKTMMTSNANELVAGSIDPHDVFDLMQDALDTLNQQSKFANFRADFLFCKNYAPLNPTGNDEDENLFIRNYPTGFEKGGGIGSGQLVPDFNPNTYVKSDNNTLDLYCRFSGFPEDEDPTKYGIAIYRQSKKTFKGSYGEGDNLLNRFSRGRGNNPNFESSGRNVSGFTSYGAERVRTYKKMVGLKLSGKGWTSGQVATTWISPTRISDLQSGTFGRLFAMDYDDIKFEFSVKKLTMRLRIFNKIVASKSFRFRTRRIQNGANNNFWRRVKFSLPIDIRLVHQKPSGTDETVKILWSGTWEVTTIVPTLADGTPDLVHFENNISSKNDGYGTRIY